MLLNTYTTLWHFNKIMSCSDQATWTLWREKILFDWMIHNRDIWEKLGLTIHSCELTKNNATGQGAKTRSAGYGNYWGCGLYCYQCHVLGVIWFYGCTNYRKKTGLVNFECLPQALLLIIISHDSKSHDLMVWNVKGIFWWPYKKLPSKMEAFIL